MYIAAQQREHDPARLGSLLLAGGFVQKHELQEALKISRQHHQPVGQILQNQQRLTGCEKRSLLNLQSRLRRAIHQARLPSIAELGCRLGDLLLECEGIPQQVLRKALKEQEKDSRMLGSILLQKGLIDVQRLTDCLRLQQKLLLAAAAALAAVSFTATATASDYELNKAAWGRLQPNFNTQASHVLGENWRKPGFTRANVTNPYSRDDEIMRSKNGKMVLKLTDTGVEFRKFF